MWVDLTHVTLFRLDNAGSMMEDFPDFFGKSVLPPSTLGASVYKTVLRLIAALVFSTGLIAISSTPAQADSGCISRYEFRHVKFGTTLKKARKYIGARGIRAYEGSYDDGNAYVVIRWRECGEDLDDSYVYITFGLTEFDAGDGSNAFSKPYVLTRKEAHFDDD